METIEEIWAGADALHREIHGVVDNPHWPAGGGPVRDGIGYDELVSLVRRTHDWLTAILRHRDAAEVTALVAGIAPEEL